ncbi:succinylglutamate desuccinylase [Salinisphaera hydrothermalis]|uniref:succinylglutamate desuccinylase n=1 Tax=Salinisphaera hydrothermalis TaxID=563188 RepID=UPI00333E7A17
MDDETRCSPRRLRDILSAAMADRSFRYEPIELAGGGRVIDRGPGIAELVPAAPVPDAAATIISAGIHGNETAPLELLLDLAGDLDDGGITVGAPTLLIVGHPASIVAETRYIETNLNRLFTREVAAGNTREHARARELMDAVDAFWAAHAGPGTGEDQRTTPLHLDMHTAIRESRYPRFAVEPLADIETPASVWRVMAAAGLQAVLSQHAPSPTFSHYSRAVHHVVAFTLELGRVARFGGNDLAPLASMADWLAARVSGQPAAETPLEALTFFRVVDELCRVSEDFSLGFDDDVANFTAFEVGAVIARDGEAGETVVADAPVYVVFPNARVERGARAALLARPVSASSPRASGALSGG